MDTYKKQNIKKVISRGQTGVDRAALDFAMENNISCAAGAQKEDGPKMVKYRPNIRYGKQSAGAMKNGQKEM